MVNLENKNNRIFRVQFSLKILFFQNIYFLYKYRFFIMQSSSKIETERRETMEREKRGKKYEKTILLVKAVV